MFIRALLLAVALMVMVGCAGDNTLAAPSRFAGTYNGTWVNVADATDAGTSHWVVSSEGVIDGQDFDPVRHTTFHVVGTIDANGHVVTQSTPTEGGAASLNGTLSFDAQNRLDGNLVWGLLPPLTYRYTFTAQ